MLSWQIAAAAAGEHGDQLRRDAAAARSARAARASADETPASGRLALDPEDVYPDEPAEGRGARRRASSGRRR
ncbi:MULTISPECIES: hypothetical protein [unclassified Pseudofrankia]|uniref:hypothetical protein n=1 Tax=unclassified Pseudofrankia TaxID=2994372 RepID=UPI0008DA49A7|nr:MULTISPECIES: hypothetical protein [unclassified Pseudofrankia]MDT3442342.1 hypothetical protein [Pseudofrankia sp. BMG5.37]OHV47954.1 hypothetical protein BCD48_16975 [Pseudofrankia sp. BMG5.36]